MEHEGRTKMKNTSKWLRLFAMLLTITMVAAACGSSGDGSADGAGDDDGGAETEGGDDGGDGGGDDGDGAEEVTATQGGTLQRVLDAGVLQCGGNDTLPGFGVIDAEGEFSGFDIDFCRVVAAAVLGDADAVEFTPLEAAARFPTLQSGDIDVLIRNTTWTASRDGAEQANFLHTTFYDGQGFMVLEDSSISTLEDMAGATICVLTGTTTLLNLNATFADRGIDFTPLEFGSDAELSPAFQAGQCEVWTTDSSGLAAFAAGDGFPATRILPDIISKEPLGPVVADGDTQWAQIVNWATMATVQAWEFGITSDNIDSFADTEDSNIRRFLGLPIADEDGNEVIAEVELGLPTSFATDLVTQVGNYQEIFEANLGPINLTLEGSPNDIWTNGGLQYVPPFR